MDQTDEAHSTRPKRINKESNRSEIWHYFAYKSNEKGEATDLNAPLYKRCFKFVTGGNTSNLANVDHLSLDHPDLFKEFRDRHVSPSFN